MRAAKDDRLPRLDIASGKQKGGRKLGQDLLNQIVLSHRYATTQQQQVTVKSLSDQLAQGPRLIGSDGQLDWFSPGERDLYSEREAVGVSDLAVSRCRGNRNDLIAG